MEENFSKTDLAIFEERGTSLDDIAAQFYFFKNGISKINLVKPAKIGDGILVLTNEKILQYASSFDTQKDNFKLLKFVPASGAASRMFKFLSAFLKGFKIGEESLDGYITRNNGKDLDLFFSEINKFPFYNAVLEATKKVLVDYEKCTADVKKYAFVKTMLSSKYLDFANQPKGVLPFHAHNQVVTSAVDEHLKECCNYVGSNKKAHLHLTVSQEHQGMFEAIVSKFIAQNSNPIEIEVSYSYQSKATDVIAYNLNKTPFRDSKGNLVFRPAGHGALIQNLNQLDADLIFIKNIDNVNRNQTELVTQHKKALAGILIEMQNTIFGYVTLLKSAIVSEEKTHEIILFLTTCLSVPIAHDFLNYSSDSQISYLLKQLNRPIRVCGMVKNGGDPGGGPFWVLNKEGLLSLQIIEASQVDLSDKFQNNILCDATHFNPVDLVCGIKDSEGNKFNLLDFVDDSMGFIVEKSKNGLPYQAYELPGLWNGAMAGWLTVFVEVPMATFSPVKTVNDLLRAEHQPLN